MKETLVYQNWEEKVVYPAEGADPQVLAETEKFKAVVAGLAAGQKIPPHPAETGVYVFQQGNGIMTVDEKQIEVAPGSVVITADGAIRSIEAHTRLSFIAVRVF